MHTSLDNASRIMYYKHSSHEILMVYAQKQKYRITLELDVLEDFNPRDINWEKLFDLGGDERVEAYIEDLSNDRIW